MGVTVKNRLALGLMALMLSLSPLHAAALKQAAYDGTLGAQRIGLVLDMDGAKVAPSRYYYYRHLVDIPLTGEQQGGHFTLHEQGGTFTLHFVGNGSEHGQPFTFDNSVGLEGTWSDGKQTLPVKLQGGGLFDASAPGHWYASISDLDDEAFEAKPKGFREAVIKGDSAQAARYVHFPLRINHGPGKHEQIANAAALAAAWKRIFTPAYVARVADASPHYMAVVQGYAMLGDGLAFFSDKGTEVLNVP